MIPGALLLLALAAGVAVANAQTPAPAKPVTAAPVAAAPVAAATGSPPAAAPAIATPVPADTDAAPITQAVAPPPPPPPPSCLPDIALTEHKYGIPTGLLAAVALAESGRVDTVSGRIAPWAWAVNALGDGHFYATEAEASEAVTMLLNGNEARIDVGCMQIDLYHHPDAFQTLHDAFDPRTNVDYAGRFLRDLAARTRSWSAAAAAYHSGTPAEGGPYVAKVLYFWKTLGLAPVAALAVATTPAPGAAPDAPRPQPGFTVSVLPETLDIAAQFYGKRDYDSAQLIYRALLDNRPDDHAALLGMGEVLEGVGRYEQARTYLERLVSAEPTDPGAIGALLADLDQLPPGPRLTALMAALQIAPAAPAIPSRIAALNEAQGDIPAAVAAAGRAAALAPKDPAILLNYASLLDRHGDRAAAVQGYSAFLAVYRPTDSPLSVSVEQIRQRITYLLKAGSP